MQFSVSSASSPRSVGMRMPGSSPVVFWPAKLVIRVLSPLDVIEVFYGTREVGANFQPSWPDKFLKRFLRDI